MSRTMLCAVALAGLGSPAAACPNYDDWGQSYVLTGEQLYAPVSFSVTAGGGNRLSECAVALESEQGDGYFTSAPDFTFDLVGLGGYDLEVRVVSDCDAALLVNTSRTRWFYDDDANGNLDPMIRLSNLADGHLDVWVGTFDGTSCPATLTLETFLP